VMTPYVAISEPVPHRMAHPPGRTAVGLQCFHLYIFGPAVTGLNQTSRPARDSDTISRRRVTFTGLRGRETHRGVDTVDRYARRGALRPIQEVPRPAAPMPSPHLARSQPPRSPRGQRFPPIRRNPGSQTRPPAFRRRLHQRTRIRRATSRRRNDLLCRRWCSKRRPYHPFGNGTRQPEDRIDCEKDRVLRAARVGMLREAEGPDHNTMNGLVHSPRIPPGGHDWW
jgi:hypothetical protein